MSKKNVWSTRLGFYLVAIGSACGLGNLWRFPVVVGDNGGGAFVLLYVMCALLLGLPLLIGELILGRKTGKSVMAGMEALASNPHQKKEREALGLKPSFFRFVGTFAVLLSMAILSYYAVISGWVLHFVIQFLMSFTEGASSTMGARLSELMNNGWLQIGLASVHLLLVMIIVLKGVQEGLEKWVGYMMPAFGVLLVILMYKSISLPSGIEALRFLLYPDFSKLNLSSLLSAIGHVCFTLSVGLGTMVTFGSYMRDQEHIPTAGFRVTLVDTFVSVFAGLLIFPIVLSASNIPLTDPGLLFEALPRFLLDLSGGQAFGLLFFVCLYLATLGATIGLFEMVVSNLQEKFKWTRAQTTWVTGLLLLIASTVPALSSSVFKGIRVAGMMLLEILDAFLINLLLPVLALLVSVALSYGLSLSEKRSLFVDNHRLESVALFEHWTWILRYLVPALIVLALALHLLGLLF